MKKTKTPSSDGRAGAGATRTEREPKHAPVSMGVGVLTWYAHERRSDRYGFVYLLNRGGNSLNDDASMAPLVVPQPLIGTQCRLLARILETRRSTHIGDLFRGIFPRTPQVGEVIVLGVGLLSLTANGVGLKPLDGRDIDWLDIRALYDAHEQTVELFAEPVEIISPGSLKSDPASTSGTQTKGDQ